MSEKLSFFFPGLVGRGKFSMLALSGLKAWWDVTDANAVTKDEDDLISQLTDKSGNSNHAVQATGANQPTFLASAISGQAVAVFDGAASFLAANSLAASFTGTDKPITVVVAGKSAAAANTGTMLGIGRSTGITAEMRFRPRVTGRIDDAGTSKLQTVGTVDVVPHVWTFVMSGTALNAYEDGAILGDANFDTDVGAITLDRLGLGCFLKDAAADFFSGQIAEVVVFNRAISAIERAAIEGYFQTKYHTIGWQKRIDIYLRSIPLFPSVAPDPTLVATFGVNDQRQITNVARID